ncbi:MAG: IS30 family transposase [Burkholderiales bacterium]|nr:IS30 family transposase [Burkholderiales bacterium]
MFGIEWYFCHPYCSWERGLNENTNGLIRRSLPKGTDFNKVSDLEIRAIQNNLNARYRKRIRRLTPTSKMVDMVQQSA